MEKYKLENEILRLFNIEEKNIESFNLSAGVDQPVILTIIRVYPRIDKNNKDQLEIGAQEFKNPRVNKDVFDDIEKVIEEYLITKK